MSRIEWIAVAFGLAAVWLSVKRSRWTWPTGLVQVTLYLFVFYEARLYSDVALHLVYVVLQFYGWFHWSAASTKHDTFRVRRLTSGALPAWLALIAAVTTAWGLVMDRLTDAAFPYLDALIAAGSLVAQYLMARKVLESWWFWIAVDVLAIGVYAARSLYPTAGLYAVFLLMCLRGLVEWRRVLGTFKNELTASEPGFS